MMVAVAAMVGLILTTLSGRFTEQQLRTAAERAEARALLAESMVEKLRTPAPIRDTGTAVDGAEVRRIPAGDFIAGTDPLERRDLLARLRAPDQPLYATESRRQTRSTPEFFIHRYEVTTAQFAAFKDVACRSGSTLPCPQAWRPRFGPRTPATFVGYEFAAAYCGWVRGSLPTEDEWEKAARGTDGRIWPWGNEPDQTRFQGASAVPKQLADVGSHPAGDSPYGLSDMAGNVWELTTGTWQRIGGHTMRGGSYLNTLAESRAAVRYASSLEDKGADYLGFRCVVAADSVR